MRQAGRYMPEYRAIRARVSMLDAIRTPEIAHEITLQPVNTLGVDAAILFSDILPPLIGMGLDLDFVAGEGPQIGNPLRTASAIEQLRTPPAEEALGFTFDAIRLIVRDLEPRGIPLIGFAGAPFTLASYAIEGGGSKNYERAKSLMWSEPAAWKLLMSKFVTVIADYLICQAQAGASALQIFDSWAGALSPIDYQRHVAPATREVIERVKAAIDVPVISFSTGTGTMLDQMSRLGADVVSVDWRIELDRAWETIGFDCGIQGNLDPVLLFAPWDTISERADQILNHAARRPGHIFNLGHGILPGTPVDHVRRLVAHVHERSGGMSAGTRN
jgi:uroporphyrinogen decarboxylase